MRNSVSALKGFKFILASASPRRRSLLKKAGFRFRVVPSGIIETAPRGLPPSQLVRHLAYRKALSVARQFPGEVVLGADTLVAIGGTILGKPRDARHAQAMLRKLSGEWQRVYTGVAVVWDGGRRQKISGAVSAVKFRKLSPEEIESASRRNLDKAGGYAVQEKKDGFVEKIMGGYDNVVGLPVETAIRLLSFGLIRRSIAGGNYPR